MGHHWETPTSDPDFKAAHDLTSLLPFNHTASSAFFTHGQAALGPGVATQGPLHRLCPLPGMRLPFSLLESYHECLWTPCSVGHPHCAPTHLIIPYFLILFGSFLGFISIFMYFPCIFLLPLSPAKLHEGMDQVCFIYYFKTGTAGHRASIQ